MRTRRCWIGFNLNKLFLNKQEFVFGNGMDDDNNWTDKNENSEWRIDAVRETELGKMPTGGHL